MPKKTEAAKRAPVDLEAVRALYVANRLTLAEIAARFDRTPGWVTNIAAAEGWPPRGKDWRRKGERTRPATVEGTRARRPRKYAAGRARVYKGAAESAADQRRAEEQRTAALYGGNADDVTLLRRRGFVVTRHADGFLVGNQHCTAAELRAKAQRERRLGGVSA